MSKKMITISSPRGLRLNAAAMGTDADIRVRAHEIVDVPESYGEHLVSDGFAVRAERPKKPSRADASAADKARKAAFAQAEAAVDAAQAKVDAATDAGARAEAEAELEAAKAALAAFEP
jgi:hypothetical protein